MLRNNNCVRIVNKDNIPGSSIKKYRTLKNPMQRLTIITFSSMFTYTDKKWELLDYATTMWDAIGAMYENCYFEFPLKQHFYPLYSMQNNSILSEVWKSAHLLVFWFVT